jgi:hypothetical protein
MIAACAALISINIYENEKKENKNFFSAPNSSNLLELNTNIWNNKTIYDASCYSIEDIRPCLHKLAKFLAKNIMP